MGTKHFTADAVVLAEHRGEVHVLLVLRRWDPFQDRWALPGGHRDGAPGADGEPGESSVHAAARELAEETGITVATENLRLVNRYDTPGRDPRGTYITDAYVAVLPDLPFPTAADDAVAADWIAVGPILRAGGLAFDHGTILRDAIRAAFSAKYEQR